MECPRFLDGMVNTSQRIVVLGLYNSGTSAVAGVLHHLGVYMGGPPFFGDFYEAADVAARLRLWWREPDLIESTDADQRIAWLARWLERHERDGHKRIGLKHPLLCLSAPDIESAWGSRVRYVWSRRPLDESIAGLTRRHWFADPEAMQTVLWQAVTQFIAHHDHLTVHYADLVEAPRRTIESVMASLDMSASEAQIERAAASIRPPPAPQPGAYPRLY